MNPLPPTSSERGYAKMLMLLLDEAPSRGDAIDLIARALAAHRERAMEVCGQTPPGVGQ